VIIGRNTSKVIPRLISIGFSVCMDLAACCCPSMNDEDAVLARKQTDGENEDDSGARILTRRFCHRYDNEDRMLGYL